MSDTNWRERAGAISREALLDAFTMLADDFVSDIPKPPTAYERERYIVALLNEAGRSVAPVEMKP